MIGTMGQLPIDRSDQAVLLPTNLGPDREVFHSQGSQGVKKALPSLFPKGDHFGFGGRGICEFGIPVTPGLFTVLCQKLGPSAQDVARQMVDDNCHCIVGLPWFPMDVAGTEL